MASDHEGDERHSEDGDGRYHAVYELREEVTLELSTPGAKCFADDTNFVASTFARVGSRQGRNRGEDDGDEDDDYGSGSEEYDDYEQDDEAMEEDGDDDHCTAEDEEDVVKRASQVPYWDIPTAREFLGKVPATAAAHVMHRILPMMVRSWQPKDAAELVWEMADGDTVGFAAILDARTHDDVRGRTPFVSIFGPSTDAAACEKLSAAMIFAAKQAGLGSTETGEMLRDSLELWNIEIDEGTMAAVTAKMIAPLSPQKAASLIRPLVDGGDWQQKSLTAFFESATKDWTPEKRMKMFGTIKESWKWPSDAVAAVSSALCSSGDGTSVPAPSVSPSDPAAPEPKRRKAKKKSADPTPEPMNVDGGGKAKSKKSAAKKSKKSAKKATGGSRTSAPSADGMDEDDFVDGDGDDDDMEFVSMDELSTLMQMMGGFAGRPGRH